MKLPSPSGRNGLFVQCESVLGNSTDIFTKGGIPSCIRYIAPWKSQEECALSNAVIHHQRMRPDQCADDDLQSFTHVDLAGIRRIFDHVDGKGGRAVFKRERAQYGSYTTRGTGLRTAQTRCHPGPTWRLLENRRL